MKPYIKHVNVSVTKIKLFGLDALTINNISRFVPGFVSNYHIVTRTREIINERKI